MTSRNQLLTTAGVLVCALLITGVVEARGGPVRAGSHLGLELRHHLIHAFSALMCRADEPPLLMGSEPLTRQVPAEHG